MCIVTSASSLFCVPTLKVQTLSPISISLISLYPNSVSTRVSPTRQPYGKNIELWSNLKWAICQFLNGTISPPISLVQTNFVDMSTLSTLPVAMAIEFWPPYGLIMPFSIRSTSPTGNCLHPLTPRFLSISRSMN